VKDLGVRLKYCRCCGGAVYAFDGYPIHTKCIPKHWDRHAKGINASRCKEFKTGKRFGLPVSEC